MERKEENCILLNFIFRIKPPKDFFLLDAFEAVTESTVQTAAVELVVTGVSPESEIRTGYILTKCD